MATTAAIPDLDRLRPAGTKRSSKRDLIVNAFLKQEGHLSADDLVDLIKREDHRISRATVYRTLQWMEEAGIARKVDFGEGRFRFEHSYRHPRRRRALSPSPNRQLRKSRSFWPRKGNQTAACVCSCRAAAARVFNMA